MSLGEKKIGIKRHQDVGVFAINQLAEADHSLKDAFGGAIPAKDRFVDGVWSNFVTGSSILSSATAVFDCKLLSATVTEASVTFFRHLAGLMTRMGDPLVAHRGRYRPI